MEYNYFAQGNYFSLGKIYWRKRLVNCYEKIQVNVFGITGSTGADI
jgi:hypothetical protein